MLGQELLEDLKTTFSYSIITSFECQNIFTHDIKILQFENEEQKSLL